MQESCFSTKLSTSASTCQTEERVLLGAARADERLGRLGVLPLPVGELLLHLSPNIPFHTPSLDSGSSSSSSPSRGARSNGASPSRCAFCSLPLVQKLTRYFRLRDGQSRVVWIPRFFSACSGLYTNWARPCQSHDIAEDIPMTAFRALMEQVARFDDITWPQLLAHLGQEDPTHTKARAITGT